MKIATWNVNGIRKRHAEVIEWIDRETPDVVCLQEIKASAEQVPALLVDAVTPHYAVHWHGHKGYSGVALLVKKAKYPDAQFTHPELDMENRIVVAETGPFVFGSVYIPNGGKDYKAKLKFLNELVEWATQLRADEKHLVLCGDFNVAFADQDVHPLEQRRVIGQLPEERAKLYRLFDQGCLVDVARKVAPDDDRLFTWWAPWRNLRQRNIGWRLDYVAASAALVDEETHCVAYRDVGTSDHGPVIAHLRDAPSER